MAWSQSDLDAIELAIVSGKQTVEYDGRRVVYRSMSDLFAVRRLIMRAIGKPLTDGVVLPITNKDLSGNTGLVNPNSGNWAT